jgi:hypothetical protein
VTVAAREGDLAGLLAVLDPDVVLRADLATVRMGAAAEARGAAEVTGTGARPVSLSLRHRDRTRPA